MSFIMARSTPTLLVTFLLLAGLGSPNASGDPPGDTFTKELKALAGMWRPISAENNGYKSSEENLKGTLWIRDADGKWTARRGDKTVVEWAVKKIDATKNPKTIDIEITAGEYKGVVYLGIYELEGDTLRICFALPDRPERPTEFSASKGTIRALSEFKRENGLVGRSGPAESGAEPDTGRHSRSPGGGALMSGEPVTTILILQFARRSVSTIRSRSRATAPEEVRWTTSLAPASTSTRST